MLPTAQFREGSYSFVVKHWVISSKQVENAWFFAHFGRKVHNSCQFPREIIIVYQQNSENHVFLYVFEGLVQIEAIPYPIASIWLDCFEVETLEKHPNCKTLSRLGLVCLCPKRKTLVVLNLPCNAAHCTVWRGIILICGQTLSQSSKQVENAWFFNTCWHKSAQFFSISQRNYHSLSAKLRKPCVFAIFQGLVQIEAIPYPIASIWLDCFEVETLRNIQTAKHCLVWISFVFAQKGKHWSCSTCLAMLPTAQFREGSYSFVVKHWVKVQNKLKTHGFLHILAQKCPILVSFPENLSYFISKTQKTLCFCNFPGARSNKSNS